MRRMSERYKMRDGCELPRNWEAAVLKIIDEIEAGRKYTSNQRFVVQGPGGYQLGLRQGTRFEVSYRFKEKDAGPWHHLASRRDAIRAEIARLLPLEDGTSTPRRKTFVQVESRDEDKDHGWPLSVRPSLPTATSSKQRGPPTRVHRAADRRALPLNVYELKGSTGFHVCEKVAAERPT